jgi:EAL domain-containing protein (putative c-di-GMP-specific phosphodiesterase class I)
LVETGETGLPGSADFAEAAGARLARLAADDDDYTLTMFRFDDLSGLRERLDDEARERLNSAIGGVLRANAVDGDMASEINSDSYGVIHRPQADVAGLEARLVEITRKADPEAHGVGVRYAALDLDLEGKTADESTKALNYVLNRFAESDAEEFSIENLSGGLSSMMEDAVDRIGAFRDILNNDEFTMAFQPVVDLHTRRPHHFEALARFPNFLGTDEGTYGAITFAEHTGLITEFDLAMCAKVLDWLDQAGRQGMRYKVAVNISGSSIATPSFVSSLHHMLAQYPELRESILFEVTESAKIKDLKGVNRTLQSLRCEGHKVCLDDFGAGAAAFRYLRELEVDVVKIDGAYVKGAIKTEKSMAFLKAMARLCVDLGITTIAEMVEDERSAKFLIDCGIDYGQGYLFGRPSEDISAFEAPRPTDFNKPKVKIAGWGQ